jgi:F-type H+-transporting ATPase subunit a
VPAAPVTEHTQKAEGAGSGASEPAGVTEKEAEVEFKPIFRASTADLNMTLALALIAVIAIQYFGFQVVGFHYSSKFINFKNPIEFVLGILEFLSELSRIISFTFRLFGNIFAGEVLLAVMAFLMPFIVPLPFLMLELFVGFIQALVFSMLTAVFLNVAVSHGKEH